MTRIAVMQPYFLPYAGYFRLMCNVDVLVLLDDVQFPKGGWVHRNRLRTQNGGLGWLTLPLAKAPLNTLIADLRFRYAAREALRRMMCRFPATDHPSLNAARLVDVVSDPTGMPVEFITAVLQRTCDILDLTVPMVRSSSLALSSYQADRVERLVALCRHFGADTYLNAPGGRRLYDRPTFRRYGIDLQFLPEYRGSTESILQRLHESSPAEVRKEIVDNLR